MAHERLRPAFSLADEKIAELNKILPEAFADGKINFDSLKEALGDFTEDEDAEHFGLFWPGKKEAKKSAFTPVRKTLFPESGKGINEAQTPNIFISGENLDCLKNLHKTYAGKINIIYIDPPYNTGSDFVYKDDFTESVDSFLVKSNQVDSEGNALTTNKKSDGRYHSNWLSMMYPRLKIANLLLSGEGVIFMSIDDNEVQNLKLLCNEIFGEENFISQLVWEKKKKGTFLSDSITSVKEYVLCFCKDRSLFNGLIGEIKTETETYPCINASNKRQKVTIPKGINSKYKEKNFVLEKGSTISVTTMDMILHSDLVIKDGVLAEDLIIEGNWRYKPDQMVEYGNKKEIYITQELYLRRIVNEPRYKTLKDLLTRTGDDEEADFRDFDPDNLFLDGWGSNEDGVEELRVLFGIDRLMDYPKPVKLISKLLASTRMKNAIVLDFFAGSGTTAQAVFHLNAKDGGTRKFILIQLDEKFSDDSNAAKNGIDSISELCRQRILKVIDKYHKGSNSGFKVFSSNDTNFKYWQNFEGTDQKGMENLFDQFSEPLSENWKEENLLYEILLIEGFPLDSNVSPLVDFKKNSVKRVASEFCEHRLVVCLDKKIDADTIKALDLKEDEIFVCLDSAITDQEKLRLSDKGLIKTI